MLSTIQFGHAHELSTLVGAADAQKSSTGTTTGSGSSTTSRLWTYSESLTRPIICRPVFRFVAATSAVRFRYRTTNENAGNQFG